LVEDRLKRLIRDVPDFPKEGIIFKDITTLLKDESGFRDAVEALHDVYRDADIEAVASVEARGFIVGAPLAYLLGAGFVPIRKPGKLPADVFEEEYELEYGTDRLQVHRDAFDRARRVLVADDLLATGGTALATARLVEKCGAEVVSFGFIIELEFLNGREKIADYDVVSLIKY
jgi:adenine phosphoribosyltransferase